MYFTRIRLATVAIVLGILASACGSQPAPRTAEPTALESVPSPTTTRRVILTSGAATIPIAEVDETMKSAPTTTSAPGSFRLPSDMGAPVPTTSVSKIAPTASATTPPALPTSAEEARVVRWSLSPGECQCPWTLELFGNGTGVFASQFIETNVQHDAATFVALADEVTSEHLVTGSTDCGREVDGNAPILELAGIGEFDECLVILDGTHPLIVHLTTIRDDLLAQSELAQQAGS